MKIAIVGAGISGLASTYILSKEHTVTLYEKNDYLGGHANTFQVPEKHRILPVDTGFIVFNHINYPNLSNAMFHDLDTWVPNDILIRNDKIYANKVSEIIKERLSETN